LSVAAADPRRRPSLCSLTRSRGGPVTSIAWCSCSTPFRQGFFNSVSTSFALPTIVAGSSCSKTLRSEHPFGVDVAFSGAGLVSRSSRDAAFRRAGRACAVLLELIGRWRGGRVSRRPATRGLFAGWPSSRICCLRFLSRRAGVCLAGVEFGSVVLISVHPFQDGGCPRLQSRPDRGRITPQKKKPAPRCHPCPASERSRGAARDLRLPATGDRLVTAKYARASAALSYLAFALLMLSPVGLVFSPDLRARLPPGLGGGDESTALPHSGGR